MPKKITVAKKQADRRPKHQETIPEPDDLNHPCRDTRETPAPNPNGEPVRPRNRVPATAKEILRRR